MLNSFCASWRKEVLHQLKVYNKWHLPKRNLKIGDIDILTDNTPAAYWPLSRVESVQSNKSRETETSTYVRPVYKLIYLDLDEEAFQA